MSKYATINVEPGRQPTRLDFGAKRRGKQLKASAPCGHSWTVPCPHPSGGNARDYNELDTLDALDGLKRKAAPPVVPVAGRYLLLQQSVQNALMEGFFAGHSATQSVRTAQTTPDGLRTLCAEVSGTVRQPPQCWRAPSAASRRCSHDRFSCDLGAAGAPSL